MLQFRRGIRSLIPSLTAFKYTGSPTAVILVYSRDCNGNTATDALALRGPLVMEYQYQHCFMNYSPLGLYQGQSDINLRHNYCPRHFTKAK